MMLQSFPKVELHLHLDCSLSYAVVARLAPSVSHAAYRRDFVAPARCANLADYLTRAPQGYRLMQTALALELVTADLFAQLQADGVIYAELRFAPLLHTAAGLTPAQVVEIVARATDQQSRATGIEARLILCTLRHFSAAQSLATAQLVAQFRGTCVTALDLAGDEAGYPLTPHVAAYAYAIEQGLYRTAHAGEGSGPASVWETLRWLQPTRLGHGTRSIEDPQLVEHLRQTGLHLELCPSANVQIIPSIPSWDAHPLERLYRAGVRLNLNTDTRMLTPTTLTHEYTEAQRFFGWSHAEFRHTNRMAVEAAFVEAPVKERLRQIFA